MFSAGVLEGADEMAAIKRRRRSTGRDEAGHGAWQPLSGFGVAVNLRAPFNTIFRAELGKSVLPSRYDSLGSTTLQIQFLKPLK